MAKKVGVQVQFTRDGATVPKRASEHAAGYDLTAVHKETKNGNIVYFTGVCVAIPKGFAGFLFPRSSIRKYGLSMANSVGVIDSDYRGEIQVSFRMLDKPGLIPEYQNGDRIAQLIIMPVAHLPIDLLIDDDLGATKRGKGGHGSTGTK